MELSGELFGVYKKTQLGAANPDISHKKPAAPTR